MIRVLFKWVMDEKCGCPKLLVQLFKNDELFLSESKHFVTKNGEDCVDVTTYSFPKFFNYVDGEKLYFPKNKKIIFNGYDMVMEFQPNDSGIFVQLNN